MAVAIISDCAVYSQVWAGGTNKWSRESSAGSMPERTISSKHIYLYHDTDVSDSDIRSVESSDKFVHGFEKLPGRVGFLKEPICVILQNIFEVR